MEGCKAGSFPSKLKRARAASTQNKGVGGNIISYTLKKYQAFLFSVARNFANNNVWQIITKKQRIRFITFGEPEVAHPCYVNLSPGLNIFVNRLFGNPRF